MSEQRQDDQPISLGEFITLLEARPADQRVSFDFAGLTPGGVDSYRGYYDHLAIGFADDGFGMRLVGDLLEELKGALGKTFEGYKGGDFTMNADTPLWVANYGQSGNTVVVGLRECSYWTVIATGYCEEWEGGQLRALQVLNGLGLGNANRKVSP